MLEVKKVFVKPGPGVKVPLPLPGGGLVPAAGKFVRRDVNVERLITSGDLVLPMPSTLAADEPPATTPLKAKG